MRGAADQILAEKFSAGGIATAHLLKMTRLFDHIRIGFHTAATYLEKEELKHFSLHTTFNIFFFHHYNSPIIINQDSDMY